MLAKDAMLHDLFEQINRFRLAVERTGRHHKITADRLAIIDTGALADTRRHARRMRRLLGLHLMSTHRVSTQL